VSAKHSDARERLITAAQNEIRRKGYNATRVEDICAAAGVTKGSFFHHFDSKDAVGAAALREWSENNETFFAAAPYHAEADPVRRLLAYVDFRIALIEGDTAEFTCLAGTMAQELHLTNVPLTHLTAKDFAEHNDRMALLVRDAQIAAGFGAAFSADEVALFMQAATQGAFVVAKAGGGPKAARAVLAHLRHYLEFLFAFYLASHSEGSHQ
jgi:TetR/AcrR family transcriptional regulator, transcriptional repressor for nem operon